MVLHAVEDIEDAFKTTRTFLTPVDRTTWVKLAFVVFFIGGPGANLNTFQYNVPVNDGGGGPSPGELPGVGAELWLAVAAIVLTVLVVALVFAFVGSVMEFVFVESLRSREVTVRRSWGRRWRQGARLFGFRLLVGLLVFGTVLIFAGLFFLPVLGFAPNMAVPVVALVLVLLPVFLVLGLVVGLVNGFTTVFVVPIMVLEECGVLAGWRRLWPSIKAQWEQYLAYAVAGFVLSLVGGILIALVTGVLALVLLIPFGLLFAVGIGVLTVAEPLGIALLVVVAALFGLAVLVVAAFVQVPVQTYLRYYALFVLGDVDADLDLIPDQRAAVRDTEA